MAHRNARLTPLTRLELVREVDAGWPQAEVARHFRVSRHTVAKWLGRFRAEGAAGLEDRSSAPRAHPRRTPPELERRICAVRRTQGFGPHRIQWALGVARSTVYAVLRRRGLNRLDRLHRVTREPVCYEHDAPGELLHLDVKKLGRVPEGGGKRMAPGFAETRSGPHSRRSLGLEYRHVAVDAHSRYAYVSVLPDERGASCAAFLEQALAAFRRRGVRVRRVLTDHAQAYTVARSFHGAAAAADVRPVAHAALPPADERQSRAFHPDPAERVGLRPPLPLQRRAAAPAPTLALPLQSPPTARRPRRGRPRLPPVNNVPGKYN